MEPQMLRNASGFLETPASDLRMLSKSLRSLLGVQLEMRFGGNPIEGSSPSLSATLRPLRHFTPRVVSPENLSRQGIVWVCACRSGLRDGGVECADGHQTHPRSRLCTVARRELRCAERCAGVFRGWIRIHSYSRRRDRHWLLQYLFGRHRNPGHSRWLPGQEHRRRGVRN